MKKGFTLVELAIVLVIIGLLIGGILVAQSMINSTKIQTSIRQVQQFDVALSNFKTSYDSYPGDTTLFSPAGDGNGLLNDSDDIGTSIPGEFSGEVPNYWVELQQSGFNMDSATFTATVSGTIKTSKNSNAANIPSFVVGNGKTGVMPFSASSQKNEFYYFLADFSSVALEYADNVSVFVKTSIKPADALAIDKKLDDGLAHAGNVTAAAPSNSDNLVGMSDSAVTPCVTVDTGDTYKVADTTYSCALDNKSRSL